MDDKFNTGDLLLVVFIMTIVFTLVVICKYLLI